MKIIFFGTSQFAVPSLEALLDDSEIQVVAIVTETDKPAGRKMIPKKSPIKILAGEKSLNLLQPEKLSDEKFIDQFKELNPDAAVLVAYGKKIPFEILKIPFWGFLNLHPSLLPKYRGASPIQTAILKGDNETGVTIMVLDDKIDHGPILAQKTLEITKNETAPELSEKLSKLGAKLLIPTLKKYLAGDIEPQKQNDENATYTKQFLRIDGKIDWKKSAEEIERMIRAFNPWPGAWAEISKIGRIKITKASLLSSLSFSGLTRESSLNKPKKIPIGKFFEINGKLAVGCGDKALIIEKLIPEGKKEMTGEEFLKGHKNLTEI